MRWTIEEFEAAYLLNLFGGDPDERIQLLNRTFGNARSRAGFSSVLVQARKPKEAQRDRHDIVLRWEGLVEDDRRRQGILALQRLLGDETLTWQFRQGRFSTSLPAQAAATHRFIHTNFHAAQVASNPAPAPSAAISHSTPYAGYAAPPSNPARPIHPFGRYHHHTLPAPAISLQAARDNWSSSVALENAE
ncbi:MAG: hypothetical protein Q9228_005839, partial [Teloschistes exilis]